MKPCPHCRMRHNAQPGRRLAVFRLLMPIALAPVVLLAALAGAFFLWPQLPDPPPRLTSAAPQNPTSGTRTVQQKPIRAGVRGIAGGRLIKRIEPVYPEPARRSRIKGVVLLRAHIDQNGKVTDVHIVRGHPLLDAAAIEAARQWQYEPSFFIDQPDQPIPVIAMLALSFPPHSR